MTTPVTDHTAAQNVDVEKSTLVNNGNGFHHHDGYSSGPVNRAITPGGHPLDTSQPAFPVFHRRIGNPAPLGLLSFASTTFVLSFYNVGIRNIATPNVIVGMAIGFGGIGQLIAGIFEFVSGNTFGATAFTSYGGFWLSFAAIYWPSSGILSAYNNKQELASALGIYLISWFIFTFLLMLATLRSSVGLFLVFFFLTLTFLMLAIGEFESGNVGANCHKAGGALGIITAFIAFYTGASGLYTSDTTYFKLPTYDLSGSAKAKAQ